MFALFAYAFITLYSGIAVFGHVLLFRDIFSAGPSGNAEPMQAPERHSGMRQQEAA